MAAAEQLIAPGDPICLFQLVDRSLSFTSCADKPWLFVFTQPSNSNIPFLHVCDALTDVLFFLQCLWPHSVPIFTIIKHYSEQELMSPFSIQNIKNSVTTSEVQVLRSILDLIKVYARKYAHTNSHNHTNSGSIWYAIAVTKHFSFAIES
jgi:hypothetical protein